MKYIITLLVIINKLEVKDHQKVFKKTKQILAGPEILTRGFIYVKDSVDTINEIKTICEKIIKDNTHNNYVEYNKIKSTIREELGKYLFNQIEIN